MRTIRDVKYKNQTILVRVDFNVPIKDGVIQEDLRIRASLPTLKHLLKNGAKKLILISHLGRPEGRPNASLSLRPVAERLQELLPDTPVQFISDNSGPDVESAVKKLPAGGILLLENLRFTSEEEQNSSDFAAEIIESTHAKLFVQDGFAVVHRAHASTVALPALLPSVAGLLLEQEVTALKKALIAPKHPLAVIIGGAKVTDKQGLIDNFAKKADIIIVGGKIAADGFTSDLPNVYIAEDFLKNDAGEPRDLGQKSVARIKQLLTPAKTIIWNGVLGQVEDPDFAGSSTAIAGLIGSSPVTSIICGGDTTGFVLNLQKSHPELNFSLVSTGGGAALEFLSGLPLPGLEALEN